MSNSIKSRFKKTMKKVSEILGIPVYSLTRDDYKRITVDLQMEDRVSDHSLHKVGGFSKLKDLTFGKKLKVVKRKKPKVLIFDIETAPIIAYVWGLWDNNVALNQIKSDWYVLSWSAKWLGDPPEKTMYEDQRNAKDIEDDSKLLKNIWKLLDEADVVITQNGVKFDSKKLNSRFILNGFQPPSSYKHIDTLRIAKKKFSFTSNRLAYMSEKLCTKYKKLDHAKFSGFELWKECLSGNKEAWKEMEKYNRYDVLSLEELYYKLIPWDNSIDFNLYHDELDYVCKCGSTDFTNSGYYYTQTGKFQKFKCTNCGSETRSAENLLSKEKRKSLRRKIT